MTQISRSSWGETKIKVIRKQKEVLLAISRRVDFALFICCISCRCQVEEGMKDADPQVHWHLKV